ncbi:MULTISPECIES: dual OB domain-containing protein [unclassified Microcoleus]|uniref:dual OB domain-containing protein n=1 Tax=unclassified Microcoleus TaxID=2642155 RepID=UPI002FD3B212
MTQIICLANSWKNRDRCIAGINELQGKWVRPVSDLPDGKIPKAMCLINRLEPALLDVLEIPLAETGPDFGFACENLSVLPGEWRKVGKVQPAYLLKYCNSQKYILHNDLESVPVEYMQSLPMCDRLTLQLVKAVRFTVNEPIKRKKGGNQWKGSIVTQHGQRLTATITDPVFIIKLELGYRPQKACLVTVSLGMPWRRDNWEGGYRCWKLIAGVVELPEDVVDDEI